MNWIFDALSMFSGIFLCFYPVWKYLRLHPAVILSIAILYSILFSVFVSNGVLYYLVSAIIFYCLSVALPPLKLSYLLLTAAIYLTAVGNLLLAVLGSDYIKHDKIHHLIAFLLVLAVTLSPVAWFMRTRIMPVLVSLDKSDFRLLVPMSTVFLIISLTFSKVTGPGFVIFRSHTVHIVFTVALSAAALLMNLTMLTLLRRTAEQAHVLAEKEMLAEMNRLKNEFYTNMSHEMKTPLTVISVNAQFAAQNIQSGVVDEETITDLTAISAEAKRLAQMVTSLVGLGRVQENDSGQSLLFLDVLVKETVRIYQSLFTRQGNTLVAETDPNLPPVTGNADQLVQVLINLLSNANRHTTNGNIVVRTAWLGESIQISVTDNGRGIDQALLPHVFERFRRGDESGTGLGLSICKVIIEKHGGETGIKSENGEGTRVWFTLPAAEVTENK